MKKLISIGVALALLTMVVVPVAVAADYPDDPGTYSKTPFGILGTGIQLVGELLGDMQPILEAADIVLPFDLATFTPITNRVGNWTGSNLAWMTDMTAWSMVLVGDVAKTSVPLLEAFGVTPETLPVADLADMFYVVAARLWDPWNEFAGTTLLPDIIIDNFPPGIDLA